MRIGVVTWFEENYGSVLQAYAMSEVLTEMGHKPVFIRFDRGGGFLKKLRTRIGLSGINQAISQCAVSVEGRLSNRRHRAKVRPRRDAIRSFIENNLTSTKKCYTRNDRVGILDEADCFLCGSDQIWNPAITCWEPFYWLDFVPQGVSKIAYAPSMGMPRLSEPDREFIVARLNSFQDVSVRESATAGMLNSLLGLNKHVETVVDPTLLLQKNRWIELCDSSQVSRGRDPYAFAYILRGNPEQRAFCEEFARNRGLKLVVYPYLETTPHGKDAKNWGDERIFDDSPADFLARIHGASLVITDSFHCTLFSILFHRDFYVLRKAFDTSSQKTRIDEILSIAGLLNRLLEDLEDPGFVESDFDACEARLMAHARPSMRFLESAVVRAEQSVSLGRSSYPE